MKRLIIEGGVGSGKTFHSINIAKSFGRFIYAAPCRQLVYESAIKYGDINSSISTGEVDIIGTNDGFCVYESLNVIDLNKYNTLIIDEAHFITDYERGNNLIDMITEFNGNILLVTATRTFENIDGYTTIRLPEKIKFNKEKITKQEFFKRIEEGIPSILFHNRIVDCGMYGGVPLTSETPPDERLEMQLKFSRGEISFIECTNILAQGLNFPAQNVGIPVCGFFDTPELLMQKLGRLGRYGLNNPNERLTYYINDGCLTDEKQELKKVKRNSYSDEVNKKEKISRLADIIHSMNDELSLESVTMKIEQITKNKKSFQIPAVDQYCRYNTCTHRKLDCANSISWIRNCKNVQLEICIEVSINTRIVVEKLITSFHGIDRGNHYTHKLRVIEGQLISLKNILFRELRK